EGAEQRPVQVCGASAGVDDAVLGWGEPAQAGGDGDLLAFEDGAADLEAVEHAGGAADVTGDGDVAFAGREYGDVRHPGCDGIALVDVKQPHVGHPGRGGEGGVGDRALVIQRHARVSDEEAAGHLSATVEPHHPHLVVVDADVGVALQPVQGTVGPARC